MSSLKELTTWLVIVITLTVVVKGQSNDVKVVCYYEDWSVYYKTNYSFSPKNIDANLCTHLIYAFVKFENDSISLGPFDSYQAIDNNGYKEYTGLKMLNPNLKTMISIGGFNEGSMRFSAIAKDETQQKIFAKNAIKFLRKYSFDGIDIDWQYPAFRDFSRPEDRDNYVNFMKTVSTEFLEEAITTGFPILLLSISIPQKIELAIKGFDVENLNKYVDWFNVVGYNFHTAHESTVNHHSPLYHVGSGSDDNLNLNYIINHYVEAGADPGKLVIGIPTFGNYYTLTDPGLTSIGSPSEKPNNKGPITDVDGYIAYFEICNLFLPKNESIVIPTEDEDEYVDDNDDADWVIVDQLPNSGPYAFKGFQWICYDDVKIAAKKAEYVVEKSLGGIMFWAIDNDDFLGNCHGEKFPIINAAKKALYENLKKKADAMALTSTTQVVSSTSSATPDPSTVKVEIVTSPLLKSSSIRSSSPKIEPVKSTESIETTSTPKPTEYVYTPIITFPAFSKEEMTSSLPIRSTEMIPSFEESTFSKSINQPKSNPDIILDGYKPISSDSEVLTNPILDYIMKHILVRNSQPSPTTEFSLDEKDDTFDLSKVGKSVIYIKNIFTSNLNLRLNK